MLKSGGRMRNFRVYGHEKKKDYTEGPMLGKIILFMLPVMFTGIIQLLYNAADMVVVATGRTMRMRPWQRLAHAVR